MNQMVTPKFGVGAPLRRKEDAPLHHGQGHLHSRLHAGRLPSFSVVVRSAMAHAKISLENVDDIRAMEGVHLVLTGAELAGKTMPCQVGLKQIDGSNYPVPDQPVLCSDEVRYVGDAIAFIVADSVSAARDAADMLEVDYDPLDVVVGIEDALAPDAVKVWPEFDSNVAFTFGQGDAAKTDEAFAKGGEDRFHRRGQQPDRCQLHGAARLRRRVFTRDRAFQADAGHPGRAWSARCHLRHSGP